MGASTTPWAVLGTKNQRREVVGGLPWTALVLLWYRAVPGAHPGACPLLPPSPVGLPSASSRHPHIFNTLENWVNGLGALREGELDTVHLLEPWQSRSCTRRALPEGST